jgi:hypothetical protein
MMHHNDVQGGFRRSGGRSSDQQAAQSAGYMLVRINNHPKGMKREQVEVPTMVGHAEVVKT